MTYPQTWASSSDGPPRLACYRLLTFRIVQPDGNGNSIEAGYHPPILPPAVTNSIAQRGVLSPCAFLLNTPLLVSTNSEGFYYLQFLILTKQNRIKQNDRY